MAVTDAVIGSDNGLSLARCQTIILADPNLL